MSSERPVLCVCVMCGAVTSNSDHDFEWLFHSRIWDIERNHSIFLELIQASRSYMTGGGWNYPMMQKEVDPHPPRGQMDTWLK